MKETLASLYALQKLDSTLDSIKRIYAALDKGAEERTAYDSAKTAYDAAVAAVGKNETDLRDVELEQKSLADKKKQVETKLYGGKVTAPKELQAMQEEVEMFGRQRERLDERQLLLMDELETNKKQAASLKLPLTEATKAYNAKVAAYNQEAERLKKEASSVSAKRTKQAKGMPADLLKRYEGLRTAKGGLAIAALEDGNACGGCRMGLSSSLVQRVQANNDFVYCDNCRRLLYFAEG